VLHLQDVAAIAAVHNIAGLARPVWYVHYMPSALSIVRYGVFGIDTACHSMQQSS
jgi:hypothetical protein